MEVMVVGEEQTMNGHDIGNDTTGPSVLSPTGSTSSLPSCPSISTGQHQSPDATLGSPSISHAPTPSAAAPEPALIHKSLTSLPELSQSPPPPAAAPTRSYDRIQAQKSAGTSGGSAVAEPAPRSGRKGPSGRGGGGSAKKTKPSKHSPPKLLTIGPGSSISFPIDVDLYGGDVRHSTSCKVTLLTCTLG